MVVNESEALRWVARQWQKLGKKMTFQVSMECCVLYSSTEVVMCGYQLFRFDVFAQ